MAMEHPVRRARHSKGGARLARLRLGRPRHPRLPHSHPLPLLPSAPQVPFESDLEFEAPARQGGAPTPEKAATGGGTQLDYFCQMVDYMKTSMSMRTTWPLKPEDQKVFHDFDFVSNKVFEEELLAMTASGSGGF